MQSKLETVSLEHLTTLEYQAAKQNAVSKRFKKEHDDSPGQICGKIIKNKGCNIVNLMAHLKRRH